MHPDRCPLCLEPIDRREQFNDELERCSTCAGFMARETIAVIARAAIAEHNKPGLVIAGALLNWLGDRQLYTQLIEDFEAQRQHHTATTGSTAALELDVVRLLEPAVVSPATKVERAHTSLTEAMALADVQGSLPEVTTPGDIVAVQGVRS